MDLPDFNRTKAVREAVRCAAQKLEMEGITPHEQSNLISNYVSSNLSEPDLAEVSPQAWTSFSKMGAKGKIREWRSLRAAWIWFCINHRDVLEECYRDQLNQNDPPDRGVNLEERLSGGLAKVFDRSLSRPASVANLKEGRAAKYYLLNVYPYDMSKVSVSSLRIIQHKSSATFQMVCPYQSRDGKDASYLVLGDIVEFNRTILVIGQEFLHNQPFAALFGGLLQELGVYYPTGNSMIMTESKHILSIPTIIVDFNEGWIPDSPILLGRDRFTYETCSPAIVNIISKDILQTSGISDNALPSSE